MPQRIFAASLALAFVGLPVDGGASAATILFRGVTNGESAEFGDKLVQVTVDKSLGNFDGTAVAAVPVGGKGGLTRRRTLRLKA